MGISVTSGTIKFLKLRRNYLNTEINELQSQKSLGVYSQGDLGTLLANGKIEAREKYKALYNDMYGIGTDSEVDEVNREYICFEELPEFEAEIARITAEYQEQFDELTSWESDIDTQITTDSTELTEIQAYLESFQQMLSTNIQSDFSFGLDQ